MSDDSRFRSRRMGEIPGLFLDIRTISVSRPPCSPKYQRIMSSVMQLGISSILFVRTGDRGKVASARLGRRDGGQFVGHGAPCAGSNAISISPGHELVIVWRWHAGNSAEFARRVIEAIPKR